MITTRSVVAAAMLALPALAKPEVNVYWGVNGNKRLADVCALPAVDYVSLAFVHESPEGAGSTGYPGTTFGNHCPRVYYTVNGVRSNLLSNCTQIQEDIPKCKKLGKKLILSIGGVFDEVNANYAISTVEKGEEWATFMWKAFGPYDATWTGPRPFDLGDKHNSVDGFDFDVERKFPDQEPWIAMINKLREYFAEAKGKFYITGAPECPLSDGWFKMKQMIARAQFDILFIQFYNNEGCHALTPGFNYDDWTKFLVGTKSARATLFIGLPAYAFGSGYIEHARLPQLLNQYGNRPNFGGVMLWDEYWAENEIEPGTGRDYLQAVQDAIDGIPHLPPFPTNSSTSTTSAPTATPTGTCSNPYEVQDDDFCFDVAARYRITVDQIMSLNPSLNKFCDLTAGQTICLPAGATEIPPTPPGVCTRPYTVQPGDWCYKIAEENGITYEELRAQNPQLDENCNLLVGDVLCLSRDPVTTTSSSVPTPTAAPICLEKYTVKPMDYCYKIAEEHGISVNQLLNYNPNLSDNCDINPGDVLCVKMGQPPVSSTSKPPVITTTSGSGPNPTGVPACGETYEVVSQDYCYKIATEHGLEFDQFIALNPQLNENCDLVPGQIVCVRAAVPTTSSSIRPPWPTNNGTMSCSGHLNSTRTHTTRRPTTLPTMTTTFTTSEVSTTAEPEPTVAPGPDCAKKYTVVAGDTCARVAVAHKTTPKKLIEINPDVLTTPCVVKAGDVICVELAAPLKARWSWW